MKSVIHGLTNTTNKFEIVLKKVIINSAFWNIICNDTKCVLVEHNFVDYYVHYCDLFQVVPGHGENDEVSDQNHTTPYNKIHFNPLILEV